MASALKSNIINSINTGFVSRYKLAGYCCLFFFILFYGKCTAQSSAYNFRHLTTSDGLSNGVIRSVTQDKYGYMWIATGSGVCLYNGYSIKAFLHSDREPLSPPDNLPICIFCDKDKQIWISFAGGLYNFDYSNSNFILQNHTSHFAITKMMHGDENIIYCSTRKGLMLFNTLDRSFTEPKSKDAALLQRNISDMYVTNKNIIYLATDTGLIIYQPSLQHAYLQTLKPVEKKPIYKLAVDANNNTWVSYGDDRNLVLQIDSSFTKYQVYKDFLFGGSNMTGSQITGFFTGSKGRLWIATSRAGICLYDSARNSFKSYLNNPSQPMSLSSCHVTTIFQDSKDFIWAGTEGYGLNYFDPDNNLFHAITPDNDPAFALSDRWYRAVTEDKDGNLWMGSMNGVTRYNKSSGTYTIWQNKKGNADQLYSNSIRSLLCDNRGNIWIGTSDGLNRYNPVTKHIDFFGEKDGVPLSFYWSLFQDHNNDIWMGCRDGLYRFDYTTHKFDHFSKDLLISPFCNSNITNIFEDNRQRMWLGCFNKGVIIIDEKNNTALHLMKTDTDFTFINNNIKSFAQDKKGTIWIATNEGLASYDASGKYTSYKQEEGLKTPNISSLLTDTHDRLWIGSGNGLFVLDSNRKQFTSFTTKDGLPYAEFNDQSAFKTSSGIFIYPTLQGLINFNPEEYKESDPARDVYISTVNVFNKKFATPVNAEELTNLVLASDENFFSLELSSPDYSTPQRTWFAYKLEPFDKNWIYTKDRLINYTNVPGGKYIFHYKASANKDHWDEREKTLTIKIATIFYRTTTFRLVAFLLFTALAYLLYRYRMKQSQKVYSLQNKAQLLEKEKAIVQYESLKQQLNPHFLFNSLTSLRSLIRIDKENAADFLDKLSLNYRYILRSSESELVPLHDELRFTQTYIDLQQARFGKGLQTSIQVSEEAMHLKIVSVTIQNLIENAIKHNRIDIDDPLVITITEQNNYLIVKNNLQLKESVETSNKYGLKHLQSLYKYLDNRQLIIAETPDFFTIKIPLL